MTLAQKKRKVKAIYRRWLEDEKFFDEIASSQEPEYSDISEVLRNLGSAIAYAQRFVAKEPPVSRPDRTGVEK
jgi:hypothetical protein